MNYDPKVGEPSKRKKENILKVYYLELIVLKRVMSEFGVGTGDCFSDCSRVIV